MTNWTAIINEAGKSNVQDFVNSELSKENFYDLFKGTELGGEVRRLLRTNGAQKARQLARKALNRR